jgi:hypothetical protein
MEAGVAWSLILLKKQDNITKISVHVSWLISNSYTSRIKIERFATELSLLGWILSEIFLRKCDSLCWDDGIWIHSARPEITPDERREFELTISLGVVWSICSVCPKNIHNLLTLIISPTILPTRQYQFDFTVIVLCVSFIRNFWALIFCFCLLVLVPYILWIRMKGFRYKFKTGKQTVHSDMRNYFEHIWCHKKGCDEIHELGPLAYLYGFVFLFRWQQYVLYVLFRRVQSRRPEATSAISSRVACSFITLEWYMRRKIIVFRHVCRKNSARIWRYSEGDRNIMKRAGKVSLLLKDNGSWELQCFQRG